MATKTLNYLILFVLSLQLSQLQAQIIKTAEIGLFGGGNYYTGDLTHVPFQHIRPSGGGFYRYNMNSRISIKGMLYLGYLSGKGEKISNNGKGICFNQFFGQLDGIGEFNFMPFIVDNEKTKYTTYLQGGLGLMYYPPLSNFIFTIDIPMGFGFKMNLGRRFVFGADYLVYKTFTDELDYKGTDGAIRQDYYKGNKDWLSYFGIYLAYKLNLATKCPAFD